VASRAAITPGPADRWTRVSSIRLLDQRAIVTLGRTG
jgi:hypothetical protein